MYEDERADDAAEAAPEELTDDELSPTERRRSAWRWRAIIFATAAFLLIWGWQTWRMRSSGAGSAHRPNGTQAPWLERAAAGGQRATVMALRALPQGGFVSATSDGRLALWGATLAAPTSTVEARQSINSVAAGGDLIVVGESSGTVRAFTAGSGAEVGAYGQFADGPALTLDLSPDNRLLLGGGLDGTVNVWDADTRRQVATFAVGSAVKLARFTGAGEALTVSFTGAVARWSVSSGARLGAEVELPVGAVASVELSPDKRTLVVGTGALGAAGGEVLLWDLAAGRVVKSLSDFNGEIGSVAFGGGGRLVALCDDYQVGVFDRETGTGRTLRLGRNHRCSSLTFTADGRGVIVGQEDGYVYRYEP